VAGGRDLGEVDRHAAKLAAGRESLDKASRQNQHRGDQADPVIARGERDGDGADRHQAERHHQPDPPSLAIYVGAEDQPAQRAHQKARREGPEREHQRGEGVARREERPGDVEGKVAVDEEVILSRKLPLATRTTPQIFSRRCSGVSIGLSSLARFNLCL
jgi:hypothetical protein